MILAFSEALTKANGVIFDNVKVIVPAVRLSK
jgi:hypothetical protein